MTVLTWKSALGWEAGDALENVKRKYRQALLRSHPNKGGTNEAVRAVFQAMKNAERAYAQNPAFGRKPAAAKKTSPPRKPAPRNNGNNGLCTRSSLKKYASRPGPPYPANDPHCRSKYKLGNDGLWYRSVPDSRGIHTWKKSARPKSSPPKSPPKKKRTPSPPNRKRSPSVVNLTGNSNFHNGNNGPLNVSAWSPMLAQTLAGAVPPGQWYVSEKLDGVRAFWDGKGALWTRSGNRVDAPARFVSEMPRGLALDGELFAGRGQFGRVNGAWRSAESEAWKDIQFRAFDAPKSKKPFRETYDMLQKRLQFCPSSGACLVRQTPLTASVSNMMKNILGKGGEGLILRRADSRYAGTRSPDMLKVKDVRDEEAFVTGYKPGTGRLEGTMGALECRWVSRQSAAFFVGAGFSDAERRAYRTKFPVGTKVTVEFMELTAAGKPRHPRFKGVRSNI